MRGVYDHHFLMDIKRIEIITSKTSRVDFNHRIVRSGRAESILANAGSMIALIWWWL